MSGVAVLRTESLTRNQFNAWLKGKRNEIAGSQLDLFGNARTATLQALPTKLKGEAYAVSCFREDDRWHFLDRIVERWRADKGRFFENPADADTSEWNRRLKAIRRDVHKAHAFVRFKKICQTGEEWYVAWHRPQHDTLDLFIRLFCRRFSVMNWTVLTASESAHFDHGNLFFGEGFRGQSFEVTDEWEEFWRTYYKSIYNPARLMVKAMKKEMPMHHWPTLPEARLIPGLIRDSQPRLKRMAKLAQSSAESFIPADLRGIDEVTAALPNCQGCQLAQGCRVTPGNGKANAAVVLVGEQPGNEEEIQGKPFVGPAGEVLRRAVAAAGINWETLYCTNAVKHFKFEPRGKLRLHKKPNGNEVAACRPWLQKELALIQPKVVVCLGSTAALSVTGRLWPVERYRGTWLPCAGNYKVMLTYHPAAILRTEPGKSEGYYQSLVNDLQTSWTACQSIASRIA